MRQEFNSIQSKQSWPWNPKQRGSAPDDVFVFSRRTELEGARVRQETGQDKTRRSKQYKEREPSLYINHQVYIARSPHSKPRSSPIYHPLTQSVSLPRSQQQQQQPRIKIASTYSTWSIAEHSQHGSSTQQQQQQQRPAKWHSFTWRLAFPQVRPGYARSLLLVLWRQFEQRCWKRASWGGRLFKQQCTIVVQASGSVAGQQQRSSCIK